jgi:hypothetical protein
MIQPPSSLDVFHNKHVLNLHLSTVADRDLARCLHLSIVTEHILLRIVSYGKGIYNIMTSGEVGREFVLISTHRVVVTNIAGLCRE